MNIIEFIEDPSLLNDQSLSAAQKVSLKAVYGLDLDRKEKAIFRKITGRRKYTPGYEYSEATFILGRRSGKSDKLASNIALFEACSRKHKLSVGVTGIVMLVASEMARQSQILYNYCLEKLEKSPELKKMIQNITATEIMLKNHIMIQVFPAHLARVRGESLVCFVGDEVSFWKSSGVNIDTDIIDAARPGLDFPYSKLIKISTPYWMRGEIYNDSKRYWKKDSRDLILFKGSTLLFNPTYSREKIKLMKRKNPVAYRTEILGEFRKDISSMFDTELIEKSINFDRPLELPYQSEYKYFAFTDVAGGGGRDSYAVCIGHKEKDRIIIDVVRSRQPKFNPEEVTLQFSELLKEYHINSVTGDKFSGDFASNIWQKFGITYKKSAKTKAELYLESESAFNTERVELPNKKLAAMQFKMLVRKTRSGGRDSVDTPSGEPEDEANVIAGVITLFARGPRKIAMGWRAGSKVIDALDRSLDCRYAKLARLSDEKLERKLRKLPEDEMLKLYKKIEEEIAYKTDPENYKPKVIINCFMLLWKARKKRESRPKPGPVCTSATEEDWEKIFGDKSGGRISEPGLRIFKW